MNTKELLNSVIQEISLSKQEQKEMKKEADNFISFLKKYKLDAAIGGSLAKNTLIKKKTQDVDVFVQLDKSKISDFEKLIKKTGLKFSIIHGSRDYIHVEKNGLNFELVPVLKFTKPENTENITDFSLIHVKYIKSVISKNKKLADEIRLAKAFCHACNCYGAESYIGGFSGYALELLVCHYGSFMKFLSSIQKDSIIDSKKFFKNKSEIFRELNQSKLQAPVILIDPTYKLRNVCAGLTLETFNKFLEISKRFLKSPSKEFFEPKEFNLSNFISNAQKENLATFEITINTNKQEGDIAGTKMKKFSRFIFEELERKEQKVVHTEFIYNNGQEAKFYLAIKEKPEIEIIGPKTDMEKAIKEFKKVRKQIYTSKGFVCAKEKVAIEEILKKQTYTAESMSVGFEFKKKA